MGGGGKVFGSVLFHYVSLLKKRGLTARSVLIAIIARMFLGVKGYNHGGPFKNWEDVARMDVRPFSKIRVRQEIMRSKPFKDRSCDAQAYYPYDFDGVD